MDKKHVFFAAAVLGVFAVFAVMLTPLLPYGAAYIMAEPVQEGADYPENDFRQLDNSVKEDMKTIGFNLDEGTVSGNKLRARAALIGIGTAHSSIVMNELTGIDSNKSGHSFNNQEVHTLFECKRNGGCGDAEKFQPAMTATMHRQVGYLTSYGTLNLELRNHTDELNSWVNRSRYFDTKLVPNYQLQPVEIAILNPNGLVVVGSDPVDIRIDGQQVDAERDGHFTFYEHNLSDGEHTVEINSHSRNISYFESVPEFFINDGNVTFERLPNETFRFQKIRAEIGDWQKTRELNFTAKDYPVDEDTPEDLAETLDNTRLAIDIPERFVEEDELGYRYINDTVDITYIGEELNHTATYTPGSEIESTNITQTGLGLTEQELKIVKGLESLTGQEFAPSADYRSMLE